LELGEGALQVPAINAFDWDAIKNITGVSLPPVGELIRCSIKIKTEARFRFAIYKMIQGLKTIFKQNHDVAGEDQRMALRDAVARMKRETEEYLKFYFNNYKENIKFQYFFKITDSAAHELQNNIVDAFQVYIKDISQILTLVDQQKINKEVAISALQQSISKSHSIDRRIKQARALLTGIN
jgi:hypothetical protein